MMPYEITSSTTKNTFVIDSIVVGPELKKKSGEKCHLRVSAILWRGHLMANQEPTQTADATYLKKKEISAFRQSVLNYIYLTFLVPFQLKFVIFYEWDVYFGTLARCWKF